MHHAGDVFPRRCFGAVRGRQDWLLGKLPGRPLVAAEVVDDRVDLPGRRGAQRDPRDRARMGEHDQHTPHDLERLDREPQVARGRKRAEDPDAFILNLWKAFLSLHMFGLRMRLARL